MAFGFLNLLKEEYKQDVSSIQTTIKAKYDKTYTIIKEAFDGEYTSREYAIDRIKTDFSNETVPSTIDIDFLKENKDYILGKLEALSEGDVKIIINTGDVCKGGSSSGVIPTSLGDIGYEIESTNKKKRGRPAKVVAVEEDDDVVEEVVKKEVKADKKEPKETVVKGTTQEPNTDKTTQEPLAEDMNPDKLKAISDDVKDAVSKVLKYIADNKLDAIKDMPKIDAFIKTLGESVEEPCTEKCADCDCKDKEIAEEPVALSVPKKYYYFINLDERGVFKADVRDGDSLTRGAKTVFTIDSEDEDFSFEDIGMKHGRDIAGLEKHLKSVGILKPEDTLTTEDSDKEDDVEDQYNNEEIDEMTDKRPLKWRDIEKEISKNRNEPSDKAITVTESTIAEMLMSKSSGPITWADIERELFKNKPIQPIKTGEVDEIIDDPKGLTSAPNSDGYTADKKIDALKPAGVVSKSAPSADMTSKPNDKGYTSDKKIKSEVPNKQATFAPKSEPASKDLTSKTGTAASYGNDKKIKPVK